jgi:hypothetical protein
MREARGGMADGTAIDKTLMVKADGTVTGQAMGAARPYDFRWGAAKEVEAEFHITQVTLKAAAVAGWIKVRQPTYQDDEHRCQCVYCFEDIHMFLEKVMHVLDRTYVKRFWTYAELCNAADRMPDGPYQRLMEKGVRDGAA